MPTPAVSECANARFDLATCLAFYRLDPEKAAADSKVAQLEAYVREEADASKQRHAASIAREQEHTAEWRRQYEQAIEWGSMTFDSQKNGGCILPCVQILSHLAIGRGHAALDAAPKATASIVEKY